MYVATPQLWPVLAIFLAISIPLAITDAKEFRLPIWLNLSLSFFGLLGPAIASVASGNPYSITATIPATLIGASFLVIFLFAGENLGFGDVILIFGLSLYTGYISYLHALAALLIGCLLTLTWITLRKIKGDPNKHIPFGPGLIVGTLVTLVLPV